MADTAECSAQDNTTKNELYTPPLLTAAELQGSSIQAHQNDNLLLMSKADALASVLLTIANMLLSPTCSRQNAAKLQCL